MNSERMSALEEEVGFRNYLCNRVFVKEDGEEVIYFGEAYDLSFSADNNDALYFVIGECRLVKYRVGYAVKKRLSIGFSPFRIGLKDEVVSEQVKLWGVSTLRSLGRDFFIVCGRIQNENDTSSYFRSLTGALEESKSADVSYDLIHQVFDPIIDYLLDKYLEAKKIENGA